MTKQAFVLVSFVLLSILMSYPQLAHAQQWTSAQKEIWELEDTYFGHLKDNNIEGMATYWHEDFVGWPSHSSEPLDRIAGRASMEELSKKRKFISYELQPQAIVIHSKIAIVHYLADVTLENQEGEKKTASVRITHTWLDEGEGWKIIGGMSAN